MSSLLGHILGKGREGTRKQSGRKGSQRAQPPRAAVGTPVAKQFHGHTRVRSLGTKERGGLRRARKGKNDSLWRSQEAEQALLNSKKPGTEEQKNMSPKETNVQSWGSVTTTEVGQGRCASITVPLNRFLFIKATSSLRH